MACKRSGVRIPLAPQFSVPVFDETVTIFGHWKLPVLSLIRAFTGARMRAVHAGTQTPEGCQRSVRSGRGTVHESSDPAGHPLATQSQAQGLIPTQDRRLPSLSGSG